MHGIPGVRFRDILDSRLLLAAANRGPVHLRSSLLVGSHVRIVLVFGTVLQVVYQLVWFS